jgi:hypothetical protein
MIKASVFSLSIFIFLSVFSPNSIAQGQDFFLLKIYHLKDEKQEEKLENYLQKAYLPALHRAGIRKLGVFKPVQVETADKSQALKVYVFVPFSSAEQYLQLENRLSNDKIYTSTGKDYIDAPHNEPPYVRIESILMQAFSGMPTHKVPYLKSSSADKVYEMRSYEAATEKLHQNKIDMFNNGEMQIFEKLGFNAVFYGKVLSGGKQPNLMYMTSFENESDRVEKWNTFRVDPDWKKLSSMPEYANNFLRMDVFLLKSTSYSDF